MAAESTEWIIRPSKPLKLNNGKSKSGAKPFYEGLYIADASIIPTALGVNPSLTISALSLRIIDKMIAELPPAI